MQPENFRFGGGASETILHPVVVVWMLVAIVLILILSRNKVVVPFLLTYFTIPLGQVLVIGGIHLTVPQMLILAVLARMAFQRPSSDGRLPGRFNSLDRVVVLWSLSALIFFNLQFMETQALIKSLGDFIVALGGYLAARFLIPDIETVRRTLKVLAVICAIQGACMLSEQFTHQNVFNFLGANQPKIRSGSLRSEGVLGTLYGGVFAGALIPMFLWLWTDGKPRTAAFAGFCGATAMVFTSHASTSLMAYSSSLIGLGFWPLRKRMRLIRWGMVVILVALHLVMNGPVWSLIEKIDVLTGSNSYHRYMLVDNCIRHFSDWWLIGYKDYGNWGHVTWDLCNQFVVAALTGGLVTLVLYIAIFSQSFGAIGTRRYHVEGNRGQEWFLWCLGSFLLSNVVSSFGINYMAQLQMFLFSLLACISVAAFLEQETVRSAEAPSSEPAQIRSIVDLFASRRIKARSTKRFFHEEKK